MAENGLFVNNSRQLAEPRDLSQFTPVRKIGNHTFMGDVTGIRIDSMLAQVAIKVDPIAKFVDFKIYGDREMAEALKIGVHSGHLTLSGELPFADGHPDARRGFLKKLLYPFREALLNNTSAIVDNGKNDVRIIVDGHRLDLDRKILIVLTIPPRMTVRAGDRFYGLLAVGGHRIDNLVLESHGFAKTYVDKASRLEITTHGMGRIEAGSVDSELLASTRGMGRITVDEARGNLRLNVHDMGAILLVKAHGTATVETRGMGGITISDGELHEGSFTTRSMGSITCKSVIRGTAKATVASNAMGHITLTRVRGTLKKRVNGMGTISANGQVYSRSSR